MATMAGLEGLNPATANVMDRMHDFFDSVVERVGNLAEALPVPSRRQSLGMLIGALPVAAIAPTIAPAAADAKTTAGIVVGQSIDGVKLGETEAQVKHALGRPTIDNVLPGQGGTDFVYGPSTRFDGGIGFDTSGHVNGLTTNSTRFKTSKGVRVGVSLSKAEAAYPQGQFSSNPPMGSEDDITTTYHGRKVDTSFFTFPQRYGGKDIGQIAINFVPASDS